jgi:hypothetical protein
MSFGNFWENEVLDQLFGAQAYSAPATLYVALSTADPTDDGSAIAEPSGNNYSRVAVTNNKTNWSTASAGALSNAVEIAFPQASGSWGTISHFAIFDDPTAGNFCAYGALTESKAVGTNDTFKFPIGDLDASLD